MKKVALYNNGFQIDSTQYAEIAACMCRHNLEITPNIAEADLVLSVGGDGTFLCAAVAVGDSETPILGINTGHLGFLTDISLADLESTISNIMKGDYVVQPRSVIKVEVNGNALESYPYALNEVAILKHDNSSLIRVDAYVDGQMLNGYLADGLVVATPTGSTAYSLSVGGPILTPDSENFCISAVAPHALSVRPVILCDNVTIDLHVTSRSGRYMLSLDGRSQSLNNDTTIRLCRANYRVNVVKVRRKNFFDTLREKMQWGIDAR